MGRGGRVGGKGFSYFARPIRPQKPSFHQLRDRLEIEAPPALSRLADLGQNLKVMEKTSKILALETSAKTLGVAFGTGSNLEDFQVLGEVFFNAGYRHSEFLSPACRFILQSLKFEKKDLSHI